MNINRATLSAIEQTVYDMVVPRLGGLGSVVVLKEENDRIRLDVISPHHFQRTAAELEEIAGEIAEATSRSIDVRLTTLWSAPKEV